MSQSEGTEGIFYYTPLRARIRPNTGNAFGAFGSSY